MCYFMIEHDTVRLLRECDAGITMGVKSISDVVDHVKNEGLATMLTDCKNDHESLKCEIQRELARYSDDGKSPNPMAEGMSWVKTNVMLAMDDSDKTVADLITDGCNMGVKSLTRYLNRYEAADEQSKDIAKRLITLEDDLATNIRQFL